MFNKFTDYLKFRYIKLSDFKNIIKLMIISLIKPMGFGDLWQNSKKYKSFIMIKIAILPLLDVVIMLTQISLFVKLTNIF